MNREQNVESVFSLGTWVGRQQALGLIAGRCTVAEMECLIEAYDTKMYLALEPTWEDYCRNRLGISRRTAERLMHTYRAQGPRVAKLNSFVRIKAREYRMFDAALTDAGLSFNGETIALEPQNVPRLAQAVEAIRESSTPPAEPVDPAAQSLAKAETALHAAVLEYQRLRAMKLRDDFRKKLMASLEAGRKELHRLSLPLPL